jgi:deoxyribonuclease (pyrimidine dimer)
MENLMTRINLVPVDELTNSHAFGEYKEILRPISKVKNALAKYPNKWAFYKAYGKKIPAEYIMGTGHETFFFDKLMYIAERYQQLCSWRKARGYKYTEISIEKLLDGLPDFVLQSYTPTQEALRINRERIAERLGSEAK